MGNIEGLLEADLIRRESMISANVTDLAAVLSDDLVWTHSSGKTEDKKTFLETIESQSVVYSLLMVSDCSTRQFDDVFIYQGSLTGQASRDGVAKNLKAKFISVWKFEDAAYSMLAWQSTNF